MQTHMLIEKFWHWITRRKMKAILFTGVAAIFLLFLQTPTSAKLGGAWCHTGNLLANPGASSLTVPPWTVVAGNWSVTSGPVTIPGLPGYSINSANNSPWFLDSGSYTTTATCSNCSSGRSVALSQTINIAIPSSSVSVFEYGGDAFALGKITAGNGYPGYYYAGQSMQAKYKVEFFDHYGNLLAWDETPDVFNSLPLSCVIHSFQNQSYAYRRVVGNVPGSARTVRFTATLRNMIAVCDNYSTTATYRNGLDNLWLTLWYSCAGVSANRVNRGTAPHHVVKAHLTSKGKASLRGQ